MATEPVGTVTNPVAEDKDPTLDLNHLPVSNPRQLQVADTDVTRSLAGGDQKRP